MKEPTIEALLSEGRFFEPPAAFSRGAHVRDGEVYARAAREPEAFWASFARELAWSAPWETVVSGELPHAVWFPGGRLNVCHNCVDRHAVTRGDKVALLWVGEPGETRTLTYRQLKAEVCRFAGALKKAGVRKGDRVALYLPMIPELPVSMLACARIGAIHSVVFGGFSAEALSDRLNDAGAKVLVTADGGWRRGKVVPLKKIADTALESSPGVETCFVVQRGEFPVDWKPGRDRWWHEEVDGQPDDAPAEPMASEDPLFILYTSGTTGKPKGILHSAGGYLVGAYATARWIFDLQESDIYWCTADIGWITGHSYVVYGPLANGATCVIYEGAPDHPERDRFWRLIEEHRVTILYTAPTAIRSFMKWGRHWPLDHDLSSLRLLGTVGEPINPEAWIWYHVNIGRERCPVVDTWWQTETGMIMITPLPGLTRTKPGSASRPFPGTEIKVLDSEGREVRRGGGYLAITRPWPGMMRGIWGDEERFLKTYFSRWGPKIYFPADGARVDEDGDFWLLGRVDDVINTAGHRLGTMEVESALVDHPAVAEAAVVGIPDEIRGSAIAAFVILKEKGETAEAAHDASGRLDKELKDHVVKKIGALARPEKLFFTAELPKTRSGKIMRRLLRDLAEGRALGDTTTLADPAVVQSLKEKYEESEG
jgi:acetyl-CoA synthetase